MLQNLDAVVYEVIVWQVDCLLRSAKGTNVFVSVILSKVHMHKTNRIRFMNEDSAQ